MKTRTLLTVVSVLILILGVVGFSVFFFADSGDKPESITLTRKEIGECKEAVSAASPAVVSKWRQFLPLVFETNAVSADAVLQVVEELDLLEFKSDIIADTSEEFRRIEKASETPNFWGVFRKEMASIEVKAKKDSDEFALFVEKRETVKNPLRGILGTNYHYFERWEWIRPIAPSMIEDGVPESLVQELIDRHVAGEELTPKVVIEVLSQAGPTFGKEAYERFRAVFESPMTLK